MAFQQIENAVNDLRSASSGSFERHIRRLAQLLHSPGLELITDDLVQGIDVEAWIAQGVAKSSSMVGSGRLEWPGANDPKRELGLVIRLIDKFADDPSSASNFAIHFYYSGKSISDNLQHITEQVFVPFARDYITYGASAVETCDLSFSAERVPMALKKVFVVHGHDESARESVARFLEKTGLEAVILQEQPDRGQTIIEKFETYAAQVGFAVVLFTPDDIGGTQATGAVTARARQNVIFELGNFVGKLGRGKVCLLRKGDIEEFSDFQGVLYTSMGEGWRLRLAQELKAAGFAIDLNLAFGS